jgi:hypothetical protein
VGRPVGGGGGRGPAAAVRGARGGAGGSLSRPHRRVPDGGQSNAAGSAPARGRLDGRGPSRTALLRPGLLVRIPRGRPGTGGGVRGPESGGGRDVGGLRVDGRGDLPPWPLDPAARHRPRFGRSRRRPKLLRRRRTTPRRRPGRRDLHGSPGRAGLPLRRGGDVRGVLPRGAHVHPGPHRDPECRGHFAADRPARLLPRPHGVRDRWPPE